jgi:hypothetical protein
MKNPQIPSLLLLAVTGAVAWAQPTNPIQRLVLDHLSVTRIPVAMDRLTTVRLPSPPADVESARVGTEPHPDALFLLAIQPGSPSFSVRALVANTNTTLNVAWKGQTYVLDLFESRQPWLSVIFDPPKEAPPRPVSSASRGVPPTRLLGLLDTAKAYGLLRQQHPAAVADIEIVRPNTLRDYGAYTIRTEEVLRWDAEDTLVFRIGISNKTGVALQYVPESLMVRAGTRIYYQSIAEANGTVAPYSIAPVYFAVTGSPDGARNALSPKNDFMILLQRVEAVTTVPAPVHGAPSATSAFPARPFTNTVAVGRPRSDVASLKTLPPSPAPAPATTPNTLVKAGGNPPGSPTAPAPVKVLEPPPVYREPVRVRVIPFASQSPAPLPNATTRSAYSARSVVAGGHSYGQSHRSTQPCESGGGIGIGFSIRIGFGSR